MEDILKHKKKKTEQAGHEKSKGKKQCVQGTPRKTAGLSRFLFTEAGKTQS